MEFTLLPKPAAAGPNIFSEMVLGRRGISEAMILRWIRDYRNLECVPFHWISVGVFSVAAAAVMTC